MYKKYIKLFKTHLRKTFENPKHFVFFVERAQFNSSVD